MALIFLKKLCICTQWFNKVSEKEKYTSHTIVHLTLFTCAFCHMRIQNLLKGPARSCREE